MRLLCFFLLLAPVSVFGTGSTAAVRIATRIPLVADVYGPAQVALAPGATTLVPVEVAANVPWTLSVHSLNVHASMPDGITGAPGAAADNRREIVVSCSPEAPGPQVIDLVYTLMPR